MNSSLHWRVTRGLLLALLFGATTLFAIFSWHLTSALISPVNERDGYVIDFPDQKGTTAKIIFDDAPDLSAWVATGDFRRRASNRFTLKSVVSKPNEDVMYLMVTVTGPQLPSDQQLKSALIWVDSNDFEVSQFEGDAAQKTLQDGAAVGWVWTLTPKTHHPPIGHININVAWFVQMVGTSEYLLRREVPLTRTVRFHESAVDVMGSFVQASPESMSGFSAVILAMITGWRRIRQAIIDEHKTHPDADIAEQVLDIAEVVIKNDTAP